MIRRAVPAEATALTVLARRSKAHWGYPADLMARFAEELVIDAAAIARDEVWVLEDHAGAVIGVHRVVPGEPAILEDLWLVPEAIGSGHGRRLWEHAVAIARSAGAGALELDADPNAVAFYERMGARRIGETPSRSVPGRALPRMRLDLP